jgi:hypothetical protein
MLEKWNIGYKKRMMSLFPFPMSAGYIKLDFIPPNPVFQYSIIPAPLGI